MRFLHVILLALCLWIGFTIHAQDMYTFEHDGFQREYQLILPGGYDSMQRYPLVIALHGAGDTGPSFAYNTGFDELAQEMGFIIAFPMGVNNGWYYLDPEDMLTSGDAVDDVAFIGALIDDIDRQFPLEPQHVTVVGYSNGALLALRLGCDLADRLSGIVAIAGTYSFELARYCSGSVGTPFLLVWGTEDETFPTDGFVIERPGGVIRSSFSLQQTRSYIATHYGCDARANSGRLDAPDSPLPVVIEQYASCQNGTAVLMLIVGQDHGFPQDPILRLQDGTTGTLEQVVWEFISLQDNSPE